jgi:hypothetical protein
MSQLHQPQRPWRPWRKRQTPRGLWSVVERNDDLDAEYQILVAQDEAVVDEILTEHDHALERGAK